MMSPGRNIDQILSFIASEGRAFEEAKKDVRDQADSTQHREELNSLYTGLYTSLYHLRFISKHINCSAAIGVEWRFVHKVGMNWDLIPHFGIGLAMLEFGL